MFCECPCIYCIGIDEEYSSSNTYCLLFSFMIILRAKNRNRKKSIHFRFILFPFDANLMWKKKSIIKSVFGQIESFLAFSSDFIIFSNVINTRIVMSRAYAVYGKRKRVQPHNVRTHMNMNIRRNAFFQRNFPLLAHALEKSEMNIHACVRDCLCVCVCVYVRGWVATSSTVIPITIDKDQGKNKEKRSKKRNKVIL